MLYQLNLTLNYNEGVVLFRQKHILRSTSRKHLQKQNNEDFFIQLLNAEPHFTSNNLLVPTSVKEILDQTHFFKYTVLARNISGKFYIILLFVRNLCRCLQPCLITSTIFGEKIDFTTAKHKRKRKLIIDLIPNDWQHLLKSETSQTVKNNKIPFKALYPYKGTRNVKDFQKLSNKEIYLTLQSNSTK